MEENCWNHACIKKSELNESIWTKYKKWLKHAPIRNWNPINIIQVKHQYVHVGYCLIWNLLIWVCPPEMGLTAIKLICGLMSLIVNINLSGSWSNRSRTKFNPFIKEYKMIILCPIRHCLILRPLIWECLPPMGFTTTIQHKVNLVMSLNICKSWNDRIRGDFTPTI